MANTQRRTIPSPTDLQYAFLIENIHTFALEDEISRFPHPPLLHPQIEPPHRALDPSQVDQQIYTKAILPAQLRPQSNTPEYVPGTFPLFPPKYTWSYTPSYVPRAVDPEVIRRKAAQERELVERSLARLVQREGREGREERERDTGERGERERVWWDTWREMGCDLDSLTEVWPVPKLRREVGPGM
jgi:Transcription factor TFIID complex subunit 8 C-term